MQVFGDYARYYDLLYRDKNYVEEAQFIRNLIQTHAPQAKSILDLGCGTGIHASMLTQMGYLVHGVDASPEMLQTANNRIKALPKELANQLHFHQGDIRTFRLEQKFDVIISLFHVVSYQITNEDLVATFQTIKEHLNQGGIFIFDIWYGPAVLSDRPSTRIKRLEDDQISITRISEPYIYPNENLVDVHYQVFIRDKINNNVNELIEIHKMRYLFKPEIDFLLEKFQLKLITHKGWMSNEEAGFNTWGTYWITRN